MTTKAVEVFKKEFPALANSFVLKPFQEKVINQVINNGSTLAVMPTGGGKSICFQVPTMMRDGLCIVITPLIALMKDQVFQLKKRNSNDELTQQHCNIAFAFQKI